MGTIAKFAPNPAQKRHAMLGAGPVHARFAAAVDPGKPGCSCSAGSAFR